MLFYISLALVVSLLTELAISSKSRYFRVLFLILTLTIPSFFAAVRFGIGTDYFSYLAIFQETQANKESRIEWLYTLVNNVVAGFHGEVEVVFFVVSLVMFVFIFLTLRHKREHINPGIGMFTFMMFFYQMSLNATRQVVAISIILYSIRFIEERKLFKFSLLILIASGFHNSAILVFPVYFLYSTFIYNKRKYLKYVIYLSCILVIIFLNSILTPLLNNNSLEYYTKYLDNENGDFSLTFIFRYIPFLLIGLYLMKTNKFKDYKLNLYFSIFVLSIILKFSNLVGAKYIDRISWNFEIVLILLIPLFIKYFNKRKELFFSWLLVCYILIYWWYLYIYTGSHETFPYRWIFNN